MWFDWRYIMMFSFLVSCLSCLPVCVLLGPDRALPPPMRVGVGTCRDCSAEQRTSGNAPPSAVQIPFARSRRTPTDRAPREPPGKETPRRAATDCGRPFSLRDAAGSRGPTRRLGVGRSLAAAAGLLGGRRSAGSVGRCLCLLFTRHEPASVLSLSASRLSLPAPARPADASSAPLGRPRAPRSLVPAMSAKRKAAPVGVGVGGAASSRAFVLGDVIPALPMVGGVASGGLDHDGLEALGLAQEQARRKVSAHTDNRRTEHTGSHVCTNSNSNSNLVSRCVPP